MDRSGFIIAAAALSAACPASVAAQILINGYAHPGEWDGALVVHDSPGGRIEALQDARYLYLRIGRPEGEVSGVDLYLGDAASPRAMFHVSSALSEAPRAKGQTGYDYGAWGDNRDWTANVIGIWYDDERKMRFTRAEVHEFQIARARLPADGSARLMAVLKRPEAKLPAAATPADSATWLPLRLATIPRRSGT